jgi:hypothetical protein
MPEGEVAISLPPPEKQRDVKPPSRGGRVGRVTTLLTAAALAAACSGPVRPKEATHEITKSPHGIEQTYNSLPSVESALNKLKNDPSVDKETTGMSFRSLRTQYQGTDFTGLDNVHGSPIILDEFYSAPVLEITYDKDTKSFHFQDETPKGLPKQNLYNFLSPLSEDIPLLTAFQLGEVNRVAIRINKKITDPSLKGLDDYNGQYVPQDVTDSKKGTQKTVFFYLPGSDQLSTNDYQSTLTHEPLHALTGKDTLSESNSSKPSSEDLASWKGVCEDIRSVAVDEAEQKTQGLLEIMRQNRSLFPAPLEKATFEEVYQALQNGDFNRLEPKTGEEKHYLVTKIPECSVIGPWEAFTKLLQQKGFNLDKLDISDRVTTFIDTMRNRWTTIMENNTIYTDFREGLYAKKAGGEDTGLGHPESDWDELIVSTTNNILRNPTLFAQTVQKLPDEKRKLAIQLVDTAIKTVDAQVPVDQQPFHVKIRTTYQLFQIALGQN